MRFVTISAPFRAFALAALLALATVNRAEGQCTITGPAALCDGTAQLCGPQGNFQYEWIGPGGFFAMDRCITVSTPGSYFLIIDDMSTGAEYGPCQHDLAPASAPVACSISGPASVCAGGTVDLCGPDGTLSYAWSGPGGFTAASKCVTVSAAGTYSLVVSDATTGCAAPPCDHTLTVQAAPVASVSGPSDICAGSSAQLCGPDGNLSYSWSGPGGFTASSKCVSVSAQGTYSLIVSDLASGCASAPSNHAVAVHAAPVASISGPGEVCPGDGIELCGPTGSMSYAWSGPGGFSGSTACAYVDVAGTYQLVVSDAASGCTSAPAQHVVAAAQCRTLNNCPRPASFWIRDCVVDEHAANRLSDADFASIAADIDAHSTFFNWGGHPRDGFCATLHPAHNTLAERAARQFATVSANECAGDLGVAVVHGHTIALSPTTHIELAGTSTSVGEWLAATDAALGSLASHSPHDPACKAAYRQIIWVAWQVNHGIGIGPVCDGSPSGSGPAPHAANTLSGVAEPTAEMVDDEPLVVEMADDQDAALQLSQIVPNPFANSARIGFTVVSSVTKSVKIGVYDLSGRLVRPLADGPFGPGAYEVRWDGGDVRGGPARNGIYFVLGQLDGQRVKAQVILLR